MTDHVADDDLVALALDEVPPAERALLSAHLTGCETCRGEYAAVARAVQDAMAATPAIAPPPGFSGRVLTAMGLVPSADALPTHDPAAGAPAAASATPTRRRWSITLAAAATALVLGAGLGVTGTLAVSTRPSAPVSSTPSPPTSAAALVTRTGDTVGTAGLTMVAGRSYLVVTVTRGRPGMAYDCITISREGQRTNAGTWTLDEQYGGTQASGTWAVPVPAGGVERVELVTASGTVWSAADL